MCSRRWTRRVLCVLAVVIIVLLYACWPNVAQSVHTMYHHWDCSDSDMRIYVDQLCADYRVGLVVGSLCSPLCRTKEIRVIKCLGIHALKAHVFEADWNGEPVIIKSVRPYWQHSQHLEYLRKVSSLGYNLPGYVSKNTRLTRETFIKQANATLYYGIAGGRVTESTERVLKQVVSECDLHGDGVLEHDELIRCWQIAESEEYMIASLLQGNPGVSKVYGICGEVFAEEHAVPLDSDRYLGTESLLTGQQSWEIRARIVLAILDLLEAIEDTPYGTLYYCDVKEANIGVLQNGKSLVAKVIDLDSGWFGESVRVLKFQKQVAHVDHYCNSDRQCDFVACHFTCNLTTNTCTEKVISNNFQVICETILTKRAWWRPHILQSPHTAAVQQEVERIVQECANPTVPQHHLPRDLLNQLRNLLLTSIQ